MIKLKDILNVKPEMLYLINEQINYRDIATKIIKSYNLKSKLNIKKGSQKGDYDVDRDIITIRPSYSSDKEFLMSVLHEIDHALDAKKMGKHKYKKQYKIEGELAIQRGGDFHDDNYYEEKAEKFAKKNILGFMKKIR